MNRMHSKSTHLYCFLCLAKHSFVVKRGQKRKISELSSRRISVVLKYLLNDKQVFQSGNEDSQLLFDNLLHHFSVKQCQLPKVFCEECEAKVEDILKLHLELEVVQMKLIDKLKCLREAITTNGSRNLTVFKGQMRHDKEFLLTLQRFQGELVKNGTRQFLIPLVYLPKLSGVDVHFPSQPLIKQEQLGDADYFEPVDNELWDDAFIGGTAETLALEDLKHQESTLEATDNNQIKHSEAKVIKPSRRRAAAGKTSAKLKKQILKAEDEKQDDKPYIPSSSKNPHELLPKKRGSKAGIKRGKYKKKEPKPQRKKKKTYKICKICQFRTQSTLHFIQHLREHETSEKIFQCNVEPEYCQATFSNQQYYELHVSQHRRILSFWKCEVCQELTPLPKMVTHMKTHQDTVYPCPHCEYCCPSIPSLVEHLNIHIGAEVSCFICSHPFQKSRPRLREHLCKVHGFKELMYQCEFPGCETTFTSKMAFQQHMDEHLKKYPCDACGIGFKTEWYLQQHIKTEHEGKTPYPCDLCVDAFKKKQELEKHKVEVHGCPMFKCDLCPKEFTNTTALNDHKGSYHVSGIEEFKCPICNKKLACLRSLRRHEKNHFETSRDYICDLCGFATTKPCNLKLHMRSHEGEEGKKHICSHCGKRFRESKHLVCHVRIHTGEKPYNCDVCGAAFNQIGPLQAHKKRHLNMPLTTSSAPGEDRQNFGPNATSSPS